MIRKLWPLLIGFAIWALCFVALYAMQALGCLWGLPEAGHRAALLAIWLVTLAGLALVLAWQYRRAQRENAPMNRAGALATAAALAASVLSYLPITFVSLCT